MSVSAESKSLCSLLPSSPHWVIQSKLPAAPFVDGYPHLLGFRQCSQAQVAVVVIWSWELRLGKV